MAADDDFLSFTDELLTLIQDTSTTTTYKYALLLAIIDLIEESAAADNGTEILTTSLTTLQIAERVIEIYWRQTLDAKALFQTSSVPGDDSRTIHVPRQSTGSGRSIDREVLNFRLTLDQRNVVRFDQQKASPEYVDLLMYVEQILVRHPIPRLQWTGSDQRPLIYHWPYAPEKMPGFAAYQKNTRRQRSLSVEKDSPTVFNNVLLFADKVPLYLLRLAPLLRPFIQEKWAEFISKRSKIARQHEELLQYLFGSDRESLAVYRQPLITFQKSMCFYCGQELREKTAVDHFIPWSRSPNNAIENLVVTHPSCNGAKSDHFAATRHLRAWNSRPIQPGWHDLVKSVVNSKKGVSDPGRSYGIARSQYLLMNETKRLWVAGDEFEQADRNTIEEIFSYSPA